MDTNTQRRKTRRWPVDGVSYPIAGDIGYVVINNAQRDVTVELNAKALRNLQPCTISRRIISAAKFALASSSCEDGVVELLLRDTRSVGHSGSGGLEPLTRRHP